MEFYLISFSRIKVFWNCFNSQRDGILLLFLRDSKLFPEKVSIPNGMEFYNPTHYNNLAIALVSIPNGMEFYANVKFRWGTQKEFQFPTGWNSTQTVTHGATPFRMFQFPTGWNSTAKKHTECHSSPCFNSQRDGILPDKMSYIVKPNLRVSIPNGMEFYLSLAYKPKKAWKVSIPNGMEFYSAERRLRYLTLAFQFPTGWNST